MHVAAAHGHMEIVKLLLVHDPSAISKRDEVSFQLYVFIFMIAVWDYVRLYFVILLCLSVSLSIYLSIDLSIYVVLSFTNTRSIDS